MAFTAKLFGPALGHLAAGRINWESDTIKAALCTSGFTPNQDTMDYFDDVTNELGTGGGYTAGGVTLSGMSATYDAGSNTLKLTCNNISISNSTLTWRTLVLYKATGTASTSPLVAYFQSDSDIASTGGETNINFAANGAVTLTAA